MHDTLGGLTRWKSLLSLVNPVVLRHPQSEIWAREDIGINDVLDRVTGVALVDDEARAVGRGRGDFVECDWRHCHSDSGTLDLGVQPRPGRAKKACYFAMFPSRAPDGDERAWDVSLHFSDLRISRASRQWQLQAAVDCWFRFRLADTTSKEQSESPGAVGIWTIHAACVIWMERGTRA
ncbi:hypothetical protein I315_00578 [Cryptococcus gattii Ru294]|nr:hypothetical protein I315_00578 [Cryptococcus gattii Ru294]